MPSTLLTLAESETTVRYREAFLTDGLNKKLAVNTPPGTYRGFRLATSGTALSVTVTADATYNDHVAVYQTSGGASLTLRKTGGNFTVNLTAYANKTVVLAAFASYSVGAATVAEVRAYELLPADEFTGATENADLVVLGTVVVPAAGTIAAANITHARRRFAWENQAAEQVAWSPVLRNPSFEHGVSSASRAFAVSDWQMPVSSWSANHVFRLGTSTVRSGAKALELNKTNGGAGSCRINQFVEIPVVPGQLVRTVSWLRQLIAPTGGSYTLNLYWGDLDGTASSSTAVTLSAAGTDASFRKVESTVVVPASVYVLKTVTVEAVNITTGSTGVAVVFDDVQVFVETGSPQALASAGNARLLQQKVSALLLEDNSTYAQGQRGVAVYYDKSTPSNEGQVAIEREDQDYSGANLPPALQLMGRMLLGEQLIATETKALLPRVKAPVGTAVGIQHTLLWESVPSGLKGVRMYAGDLVAGTTITDTMFVMTVNAAFDGTNWTKDVNGVAAIAFSLGRDGFTVHHQVAGTNTWTNTNWVTAMKSFAGGTSEFHDLMTIYPGVLTGGISYQIPPQPRAPLIQGDDGDTSSIGLLDCTGAYVYNSRFIEEDFTLGLNQFVREDIVGTGSTTHSISHIQLTSGASSGDHSLLKLNINPATRGFSDSARTGIRARLKPNDVTNAEQRIALWDPGTNTIDVDDSVMLGFKIVNGVVSVVAAGTATATGVTVAANDMRWFTLVYASDIVQWHISANGATRHLDMTGGTYGEINVGGPIQVSAFGHNLGFSVKTSTGSAASGILDYISVFGSRDD